MGVEIEMHYRIIKKTRSRQQLSGNGRAVKSGFVIRICTIKHDH